MESVHNTDVCLENMLLNDEITGIKMFSFVYYGVSSKYAIGALVIYYTIEPPLSEIKGVDSISDKQFQIIQKFSLILIRCNKNNIYSETHLMLIKFMA
jgi:hypothetical protein